MSLPGDENPNPQWQRPKEDKPQWTSGNPLGDQGDEQPQWQRPPPQSEWQREPQPQWQQPPPPAQQYPGWVAPPRTPGQAYASMILGIIGLFPICPVVLSVIALILGFMAKNEIDRSGGQLGGSGIALTGIITGGIGTALYVLFFLAVLAL
jgi:hypothetical protein